MITRRQLLAGLAGVATVVGFDPMARVWIPVARASDCPSFANIPPLDGTLHTDMATRETDATDQGNIVHQTPCAVLRPGSVEDIQKMIRFCRWHDIKVAARGQGHTTFGQGLTTGLIVEMTSLDTIHTIGPDYADVDAGVLWKDLVTRAFNEHGLRAHGLTSYLALSVGGVSPNYDEGGQVDRVLELEVVTGEGRVQRCSPTQHADLFEAALGGLGQCGIITRAKIHLVPANSMVRTYVLEYTNNAAFFSDVRTLIDRGEVDGLFNLWVPFGTTLVYQLNVIVYFDQDTPPEDVHLLRDLTVPPQAAVARDEPYLDNVLFVDRQIDTYKALGWDRVIKPWFDMWLPDATVEQYVGEVIPSLTPLDWSPTGFILIFVHRRSAFTRPFFRVPERSGGDWVYLFDILNDSTVPGPNPDFVARMLARNLALFQKARDAGGTRYPIGAVEFSRDDWIQHYGEMWPELVRRKQRYDPDNILTPGPGIF